MREDLRGRPDERVVDQQAEDADGFALRPVRVGMFGALRMWLGEQVLDVGDGLGLGEGGFVEFHVELRFEGGEEFYAV